MTLLILVLALLALGWWLTRTSTLTLVPLAEVTYFLDGEPVAGEVDVSPGTHEVLCVAHGASATTEVEVGRGAERRVACATPDQAVDVSAFWDGTAEPASVLVDGTQAVPLPTRLSLGTGHHTLRVISTRLDTTLTVDVLPTFDPAPPPPQTVAVQAGTAPPPPTDTPVAQSGPIAQPMPQQTQSQPLPQVQQPSPPPQGTGPAPARMGTVDVTMDAGVTLSLDGSSMSGGSREMSPGTYTARCQAGPLSETTRVTVTAGQRSAVRCYAPSRVVRVTTTGAEGAWMTVVVDGQPGAQTPTQVTLPVGRHTIIVRRRGNGDDGHHGGAWKIAFADTVADNGSSAFFVLGTDHRLLRDLDLYSCGMVMEINGAIASLGAGAACLGHPLNAVQWLARTLSARGEALKAGDIILYHSVVCLEITKILIRLWEICAGSN